MTSLFARVGQLETRRGFPTVWSSGKRKRTEGTWICKECQAGQASRQRRVYSDDAIGSSGAKAITEQDGKRRRDQGFAIDRTKTRTTNFSTPVTPARKGPFANATQRERDDEDLVDSFGIKSEEEEDELRVKRSGFFSQRRALNNRSQDAEANAEDEVGGTLAVEDTIYEETAVEEEENELWEDSEVEKGHADGDEIASAGDQLADSMRSGGIKESLLNLDYKRMLDTAVPIGEVDTVTRCLFAALRVHDTEFIANISAAMFSQIIKLLAPNNFVRELASTHKHLNSITVVRMGIAPMRVVAYEYSNILRRIVTSRRSVGRALTLEDYTALIKAACELGNADTARAMWEFLQSDGHKPNTTCYNYLMGAIIENGRHSAGSRQRMRVVPFNIRSRSVVRVMSRYRNYRVGEEGVKEVVMETINGMMAEGAVPDHESFRMLIMACAREGDIDTVKNVLMRVWGVNVTAIMQGEDEDDHLPKPFPAGSPLQPTSSLLLTIAHAFGINNDIASALRVVDFVARHYNLDITQDVWAQLFEWTFVLSLQRSQTVVQKYEVGRGKLQMQSLTGLWDTMTSEPYLVQPTMAEYNHLIAHLSRRYWTTEVISRMEEAEKLLEENRRLMQQALADFQKAVKVRRAASKGLQSLRQAWEGLDLTCRRDNAWFRRWLRLLFTSHNQRQAVDGMTEQIAYRLPELIWRWRQYLPNTVWYEHPSGFIEIGLRDDDERKLLKATAQAAESRAMRLIKATTRFVGNDWVIRRVPTEEEVLQRMARQSQQRAARGTARPFMQRRSRFDPWAPIRARSYEAQRLFDERHPPREFKDRVDF